MKRVLFLLACIASAGCADLPPGQGPAIPPPAQAPGTPAAAASGEPIKTDAAISNTLVDILENKDRQAPKLANVVGTPMGDLLKVGSPIGYILRNRFLNPGVPIGEALARNADPVFREKLITLARWDSNPEVRASALIAVGKLQDPAHLPIFKEALIHLDAGVRFGAVEALLVWGNTDKSHPLLNDAAQRVSEDPIIRLYAMAGLAKMGDSGGLFLLRESLNNNSWLVRAMAASFLGDFGTMEDYSWLVSRIPQEQANDFVVAEYCIAAMKIFARKPA